MPSLLERYGAGERESIWAELIAKAAGIRDAGVYDDAFAVARETMRRAEARNRLPDAGPPAAIADLQIAK